MPHRELGPLEVLAIEFPGDRFKSEVMQALASAIDQGAIRIVDVTFVNKDASGATACHELAELDEYDTVPFDLVDMTLGVLSVADIEKVADAISPGSSAAVIVIEHAWAAAFARAVTGADGRVIAQVRVPDEVARTALREAESESPLRGSS